MRRFIFAWVSLTSVSLLGACDTEGVTPNCPEDGGDCVTPPGDSAASVITGSGGSSGTGGSSGGGGTKTNPDGGLLD